MHGRKNIKLYKMRLLGAVKSLLFCASIVGHPEYLCRLPLAVESCVSLSLHSRERIGNPQKLARAFCIVQNIWNRTAVLRTFSTVGPGCSCNGGKAVRA